VSTAPATAARAPRWQVHPVVLYAMRRLAIGVVLLALVSVLVFAATQILPGDAASAILGRSATPAQKEIYRKQLGLDKPLPEQYWHWVSHVLRGDLGTSVANQVPVTTFISSRAGKSLVLALVTLAVLIPLALMFGMLAGIRRERPIDHAISVTSLALIALPEFVTATFLIALIAVSLKWLPPTSIIESGSVLSNPNVLVLPALTLCITAMPYVIRMVRAGVSETMSADYIQMARLSGIPERRIVWHHALRNALAPTVQVIALTMQYLIGGIVIVETVFAYPGLGQGLVQAVVARDIPTVQGVAILLAAIYIVINIVADVIVVLLIPKLRTSQ
jgi:peptide/nickel transport system permease protein